MYPKPLNKELHPDFSTFPYCRKNFFRPGTSFIFIAVTCAVYMRYSLGKIRRRSSGGISRGFFCSREDDLHREGVLSAVSKVLIGTFLQLSNSVKNFLSTKTCGIWVQKVGKNYVEIFPQMPPYL
ncbi:hypothetical protein HQ40_01590 [Porphyromonas gulae]|nr:hypothetical protein HQ40_01590 [Porphyromonas gulae]